MSPSVKANQFGNNQNPFHLPSSNDVWNRLDMAYRAWAMLDNMTGSEEEGKKIP